MASFARSFVCGNLTRDLEVQYVGANSTPLCKFSVAVNDRIKRGDEWVDEVSYVDVVIWGKAAEALCNNAGKGSTVTIEGRLKQETWEKDGEKRSKLVVVADRINFPSNRSDQEQQPSRQSQPTRGTQGGGSQNNGKPQQSKSRHEEYEDIPF